MKSIRLSLIVYFLVLLAGALGAVSFFVYEQAFRALNARVETSRDLLQQHYDQRKREEQQKVDEELKHHAFSLANLAVSQSQFNRTPVFQMIAGSLTAGPSPFAYAQMPIWISEGVRTPLNFELRSLTNTEIQLSEDFMHQDDANSGIYFQINSWRRRAWRSSSLGERRLPFDPDWFMTMERYETKIDELNLEPNLHVRRLVLKAPITRFQIMFPQGQRSRGPGAGAAPRGNDTIAAPAAQPVVPPPPRPTISTSPTMIVQCAVDTTQRDQQIARLDAESKARLSRLEQESRETLYRLRLKLFWIGLATFAAIFAGGYVLIGLGLAPLRRISEAVSRVSEKDIRLQYDGPPPPVELEPIVTRLQQTLDALQCAFDREKQAAADISHELRTPIAGLMTTLDVALKKTRSAEDYRATLQECRDIVKQTSNLVERLLTLTWLDARTDKVRPESIDAGELAEQCATVIRPLARAHGLTFRLHQGVTAPITTDRDKLREIMSNLMHNAIEYNRPDGSVDVRIQSSSDGLDFEVQDTGIGISPEHQDRIFERFFRADASRHATGMHAGLGLAIVRGYVQLMGGQITVESELGRGSTFRVHIPSLTNGSERQHHA